MYGLHLIQNKFCTLPLFQILALTSVKILLEVYYHKVKIFHQICLNWITLNHLICSLMQYQIWVWKGSLLVSRGTMSIPPPLMCICFSNKILHWYFILVNSGFGNSLNPSLLLWKWFIIIIKMMTEVRKYVKARNKEYILTN